MPTLPRPDPSSLHPSLDGANEPTVEQPWKLHAAHDHLYNFLRYILQWCECCWPYGTDRTLYHNSIDTGEKSQGWGGYVFFPQLFAEHRWLLVLQTPQVTMPCLPTHPSVRVVGSEHTRICMYVYYSQAYLTCKNWLRKIYSNQNQARVGPPPSGSISNERTVDVPATSPKLRGSHKEPGCSSNQRACIP